jgi:hypothetical protein
MKAQAALALVVLLSACGGAPPPDATKEEIVIAVIPKGTSHSFEGDPRGRGQGLPEPGSG